MKREDVAAFARRQWADPRQRLDYWAEQYRIGGPAAARRAASALYDHARSIGSAAFSDESRAQDFAHHLRMREQLDRAARVFTSR
jgi:hypothetical protein